MLPAIGAAVALGAAAAIGARGPEAAAGSRDRSRSRRRTAAVPPDWLECSECEKNWPPRCYSATQLGRRGQRRCVQCVTGKPYES